MGSEVYSVDEIRRRIEPIAVRYGVERVYLFGSYAKGNAVSESDIDLRVDKGRLRGVFALSGMRLDICNALEKDVDLLTTGSLDEKFRERIRKDEILIYERT